MFSWERTTSRVLDGIGLRSIKSKIIVFALSATLVPSVSMGWLSYVNNRNAIDEKIVQELTSLTSHASREFDLWLKERRYEMKVLSSSYVVSENLERLSRPGGADDRVTALGNLEDYLGSIGQMFDDYDELAVLDVEGSVLASSAGSSGTVRLSEGWLDRVESDRTFIADAYWDDASDAGAMVIAEPVRAADGAILGAMSARVRLEEVDTILASYAKDPSHELYVVTRGGKILISSQPLDGFEASQLDPKVVLRLFAGETIPIQFRGFLGTPVLGALRAIPELGWGVVAEKDRGSAYAAIARLRNVTLALISAVLLGIGLAAYLFGMTIVKPLGRLTAGSTKVSGGDLDVELPLYGRSEISYLTAVFNQMVARLRKFDEENAEINEELRKTNNDLRRLSITDGLTGLYNRTQLPDLLDKELARSSRHNHAFSILMVDIDHFKRFNDTHGHQAGDDLLTRVAKTLQGVLRTSDLAARYGGEEFLILLTETGAAGALTFAEKLRARVADIRSQSKKPVTVSVGVASFPDHGADVESIIRQADEALYRCKRSGRNRVAVAKPNRKQEVASQSEG